jgi:hypothetical protein
MQSWRYIRAENYPANLISRGASVDGMVGRKPVCKEPDLEKEVLYDEVKELAELIVKKMQVRSRKEQQLTSYWNE